MTGMTAYTVPRLVAVLGLTGVLVGCSSGSAARTGTATRSPTTAAGSSQVDLTNATLELPPRLVGPAECDGGRRVRFGGGHAGDLLTITPAGVGDVDGDGSPDQVALVTCRNGGRTLNQVVAFHGLPDGSVATIGVVVQNDGTTENSPSQIQNVFRALVNLDGSIQVEVGDARSTAAPTDQGIHQLRRYRWTGTSFAQVAGSTVFAVPLDAAHLAVDVSDLVVAKDTGGDLAGAQDDDYVGTLTVTVTNHRSTGVSGLSVHLSSVDDNADFADGCDPATSIDGDCQVGSLAAGASVTVTLRVSFGQTDPTGAAGFDLQVRVGDQRCFDQAGLHLVHGS
jgi:hypothetical protein